jgi:hypothetical protein
MPQQPGSPQGYNQQQRKQQQQMYDVLPGDIPKVNIEDWID